MINQFKKLIINVRIRETYVQNLFRFIKLHFFVRRVFCFFQGKLYLRDRMKLQVIRVVNLLVNGFLRVICVIKSYRHYLYRHNLSFFQEFDNSHLNDLIYLRTRTYDCETWISENRGRHLSTWNVFAFLMIHQVWANSKRFCCSRIIYEPW